MVNEDNASRLKNFRLVDHTEEFKLYDQIHHAHVTLLAGETAIIYRGVDEQRLSTAVLCPDAEAFCSELMDWRDQIGSDGIPLSPNASDDEIVDAIVAEMLSDGFLPAVTELGYRLAALS